MQDNQFQTAEPMNDLKINHSSEYEEELLQTDLEFVTGTQIVEQDGGSLVDLEDTDSDLELAPPKSDSEEDGLLAKDAADLTISDVEEAIVQDMNESGELQIETKNEIANMEVAAISGDFENQDAVPQQAKISLIVNEDEEEELVQDMKTAEKVSVEEDGQISFESAGETESCQETSGEVDNAECDVLGKTAQEDDNIQAAKATEQVVVEKEHAEIAEKAELAANNDYELQDTEEKCETENNSLTEVKLEAASEFSSSKTRHSPAIPLSAVSSSVFRTNPVLEELLYTLKSVASNSPSLTAIEITDFCLLPSQILDLASGLATNTHVKSLILRNCGIQTASGTALAKALAKNTTLISINLEGNQLGPQAMKEFAFCLGKNTFITTLQLGNQNSITPLGLDAEMAFANALGKNHVLTKLGLQFRSNSCLDSVQRAITRNKELARKARLAKKEE